MTPDEALACYATITEECYSAETLIEAGKVLALEVKWQREKWTVLRTWLPVASAGLPSPSLGTANWGLAFSVVKQKMDALDAEPKETR